MMILFLVHSGHCMLPSEVMSVVVNILALLLCTFWDFDGYSLYVQLSSWPALCLLCLSTCECEGKVNWKENVLVVYCSDWTLNHIPKPGGYHKMRVFGYPTVIWANAILLHHLW